MNTLVMPPSDPRPSPAADALPTSVTLLLQAAGRGETGANEQLASAVYSELRALAHAKMRRTPPGQTLQPTALVNEAYLRLCGKDAQDWQSRRHFLFVAARAMHDVLVEEARKKAAVKRGGAWERVNPEALSTAIEAEPEELLALEGALARLEKRAPEQARIVQLRFFVGLTEAEVADVLGVSERTVRREWRLARTRLFRELAEGGA